MKENENGYVARESLLRSAPKLVSCFCSFLKLLLNNSKKSYHVPNSRKEEEGGKKWIGNEEKEREETCARGDVETHKWPGSARVVK